MSKVPKLETQPLRDPVFTRSPALSVLQSVVPSSPPGSGDPAAACCHSPLRGSRFSEFAHARCAWNQVMYTDGVTPAMLTA